MKKLISFHIEWESEYKENLSMHTYMNKSEGCRGGWKCPVTVRLIREERMIQVWPNRFMHWVPDKTLSWHWTCERTSNNRLSCPGSTSSFTSPLCICGCGYLEQWHPTHWHTWCESTSISIYIRLSTLHHIAWIFYFQVVATTPSFMHSVTVIQPLLLSGPLEPSHPLFTPHTSGQMSPSNIH